MERANVSCEYENVSGHHKYFTKHGQDLQPTHAKLLTIQKGKNFMGPKLFNKLPRHIKELRPKYFAREIKSVLLSKTFPFLKEFLDCDLGPLAE